MTSNEFAPYDDVFSVQPLRRTRQRRSELVPAGSRSRSSFSGETTPLTAQPLGTGDIFDDLYTQLLEQASKRRIAQHHSQELATPGSGRN